MGPAGARPRVMLGIADERTDPLAPHAFIGALVGLGSLLRRYVMTLEGRQLVVAVSVPRRDYVAALIGTGWMLSSPAPNLNAPLEVFRAAVRNTYLRAVTEKKVLSGSFSHLDESRTPPRVLTGGKTRTVDWYRAVAVLDDPCPNIERDLPEPGFLAELSGIGDTWFARMAAPPRDLALVGTVSWLREDLAALIGNGGDDAAASAPLANYVLPISDRAASWATTVVPSARLGEGDAIPSRCVTTILDRYGAIKYLNDITTPVVVCVIDRSVGDDSAAELVVAARVSNSRPVSMKDDLHWHPPLGIEALAFTVSL